MADAVIDVMDAGPRDSRTETEFTHPSQYRTFSRNLAPSLTALGGLLAVLGGLGNWVRAAKAVRVGEPLQDVGAVMGYRSSLGWILAGLGALATAGSIVWLSQYFLVKLLPVLSALVVSLITAAQLPRLSAQAQDFVETAERELGFSGFHAGLGWGAWLLVVATVLLLLGSLVGILREMDIRRGLPE